jgi:DNA-binding XRE family transcriptional regulator
MTMHRQGTIRTCTRAVLFVGVSGETDVGLTASQKGDNVGRVSNFEPYTDSSRSQACAKSIIALRKRLGLSRALLGKALKCSPMAVWRMESGLSLRQLQWLCRQIISSFHFVSDQYSRIETKAQKVCRMSGLAGLLYRQVRGLLIGRETWKKNIICNSSCCATRRIV